jgi:hypothetical protein
LSRRSSEPPVNLLDEFERCHAWASSSIARIADIHEVRRLGARVTRARTGDQTAAAIFWNASASAPWCAAARAAASRAGGDSHDAEVLVASVEKMVALSHQLARHFKERTWHPRPRELIRGEAQSLLAAFDADWEPLLASPSDSESPCGPCVAAGAAAAILRGMLPDDDELEISVTYPIEYGLTRRFGSITEMLQECEDARMWSGLHLRTTVVESTELGLELARFRG